MVRPLAPKVSIGVPVYNGAATLSAALDSLLRQSFADFEIIISDNASTDRTADICKGYVNQDARVRYVRQSSNIGVELNFKYVLDQARAPYFMWAACDDIRSPEFLEENVRFLDAHPGYVASTCPNRLEGKGAASSNLYTFSIEGNVTERFGAFLDNSWVSHAIFYALVRTDVLRGCEIIGQSFFGSDWAIALYLASRGSIHRTQNGLMTFGAYGISGRRNHWRQFGTRSIGWIFPFYRVSIYAVKRSAGFTWAQRLSLVKRLLKLNIWAAYSQLHTELYPFYASWIKPYIGALNSRR